LGEQKKLVITGEYFKIKSDSKMDVVESLNGRNWESATKIVESEPTKYTVIVPHGIEFKDVWVRVYGMDGEYSPPALVHVEK
jgi:hypothetical protein